MKILMLSHGSQSRTEGQPKSILLGKMADIDLRVLTPRRWKNYGQWREPEVPLEQTFELKPSKVRWPWLGPAQSYLHHYPDLAKEVREFRPDVINVWEEPWSLVSAHACRVREKVCPSAKVIVETEQNIYKRLPAPFRQIRRYVLNRVDAMVGRSRESIDVLRQLGYAGRAELVPNAVDTTLFKPSDRDRCRTAISAEAGVDWSDRFVVGFVGRLVPEKGVSDLIDAIAACPAHVSAIILGEGPLESELRLAVKSREIDDRVVFLPARPHERLPEVFGAIDVLAVPSRTTARWKEQFGRVIIEAHACRVPVIGSSSGAIPDVVGRGGLIVPESKPGLLADAIRHLTDDPVLLETLSKYGFEETAKKYTWAAVALQMAHLFKEVLAPINGVKFQ